MDVRLGGSQGKRPAAAGTLSAGSGHPLALEQVAAILEQHRHRELRIARGFVECRGLSLPELEDLYQETTLALLHRPYSDEKHLCDALRRGIKQRALNLYRDERRRQEILAASAPAIHALATARSADSGPEQLALARQDRLLITEFLAELNPCEREVFWLLTEGFGYNRIARTLKMPVPVARNTVASCERKRERFQLLHDSGRLCGYRAATIKALLDGQATSEQLVQAAAAHLQACAHCRAEHKTNAQRLWRTFQKQAAALLPPVLAGRLSWLTRAGMHARTLSLRVQPGWASAAPDGARERAAAILAGTGASAKLAAGIATLAVLAGGAITATRALEHQRTHPHDQPAAQATPTHPQTRAVDLAEPAFTIPALPGHAARSRPHAHPRSPGHVVLVAHTRSKSSAPARREPGGFAYLGVPTNTPTPTPAPAPQPPTQPATHSGGPFSP